jgi:hypothetical protein
MAGRDRYHRRMDLANIWSTARDIVAQLWIALGPVVGIVIGSYLTRRAQRESWSREDGVRAAAWAREDRNRPHADKVAAYAAFLVGMDATIDRLMSRWMRQDSGLDPGEPSEAPDPATALQTIAILSPTVEQAAERLYNWSLVNGLQLTEAAVKRVKPGELDIAGYHRLRGEVIAAMRADLGIG